MAMPFLHVYLVYMYLYIVQQFIIFTEDAEKASAFLLETSLHKLFNANVVILYKMYDLPRISLKFLGIAGYLRTAGESCDGLRLQNEKFFAKSVKVREVRPDVMVKSLSNSGHFQTCVPN